MKKTLSYALVALASISMGVSLMRANYRSNAHAGLGGQTCANDDSGLKLPAGFCATVFADNIGHARHMVAAPNGVLYVNTWSGRYYGNDTPHAGGFLVALQDKTGSGKADVIERFGETVQTGGHGGTGIGMYWGRDLRRDTAPTEHPTCPCGSNRWQPAWSLASGQQPGFAVGTSDCLLRCARSSPVAGCALAQPN
jgi:hypothetical protein